MINYKNYFLSFGILTMLSFQVHADDVRLEKLAESEARNGTVRYLPGNLITSGEDGTRNLFSNKLNTKGSRSLSPSIAACKQTMANSQASAKSGESVAILANGSAGKYENLNVAVVRLKADDIEGDIFNYKPLELRVLDGDNVIAKYKMDFDAYPCAIVLDHFTGNTSEQQIAFSWVSVGNGYSAGVSVFGLE